MMRILILGGYGFTGKLLARHLLEQSGAEIILAGRHLEKATALAAQLNAEFSGQRVSAAYADAGDERSLGAALRDAGLLVVASPTTRHAGGVIRTALESGVDYLDVQFGAEKLTRLKALASDIERAGRCFITEAGFHPGLPSAMVRYAAARLDRIDSATVSGYLNMGRALPYSEAVDELMEAFRDYQAQVFRAGRWTKARSFGVRKVDFGGEIGVRDCFSMFFEELRDLPAMCPTIKDLGFYMSGSHWAVDWVLSPLIMIGLRMAPHRGVRPLGKLLWWGMRTLPRPPYLVLLKVAATGEKDGRPARVEATVSHPDGYELTAIPVVACLLQYLDGSARRPGLWLMGHLVEPARLFEDMKRMGIQETLAITAPPRPSSQHNRA